MPVLPEKLYIDMNDGIVLTATNTHVSLRSFDFRTEKEAVVAITRDLYYKIITMYLDLKSVYYPEYAGNAMTLLTGLKERSEGAHLWNGKKMVNVRSFYATDFFMEIEHG